ncbi:glycosyl transferase [Fibrobacteres bacterium R8-0-B4]
MNKKISVIIPIYNAEKYLRQTLDSIRCQTYRDLEIICVLDCPTDNSAVIVDNTAKDDDRIKTVRHPKNLGLPAARNTGVQNAAGEYMHFLDADDLINPDFYNALVRTAINTDADVAACSVFYEKKPKQSIWFAENEVVSGQEKMDKTFVTTVGWAWRYLIRKTFWDGRNLSFPDLAPLEDMPVMIPMVYYANKVALCRDALYFYKNRETSILNSERSDTNMEKERLRKDNRQKASKIFNDFMDIHKIKCDSVLRRHLVSLRTKRAVCVNNPVEYGKLKEKISVIVPIYNAEKYLRHTLDSIRFQTYKNLEIICVLDCPTDNSVDIVEEIAKEDDRVKAVKHQENSGLPTARNTGVLNASGEYMHFIDSDDLISPDFYEIMINAAVRENADVAACSVFYEKKPWRSIWFWTDETLSGNAKLEKTETTLLGWSWRYLIRKSFWNSRNFLFPDLVPMEDMPVIIPMIYHADKVVLCPNAVYFYKNRKSSILNDDYDMTRQKLHSENRQKARSIFREFMRVNEIKRPSRLLYYIRKRLA